MLTTKALTAEVEIMLSALRVPYKKVPLEASLPDLFILERFGVVVAGFERIEYSIILNRVNSHYRGYRFVPVASDDDLIAKKDELLWELMRGGYMRFIRLSYPAQYKNLLFEYGLGRKIINERLRIWGDVPKYKYLVEENKRVLESSEQYVLNIDPAFYDFMPELVTNQEGG
jgi:hypothetical protein